MSKTTAGLCQEAIDLAEKFHKYTNSFFFFGLFIGAGKDQEKLEKIIKDFPEELKDLVEEGRKQVLEELFKTTCNKCSKDFSDFGEVSFCPFCGNKVSK